MKKMVEFTKATGKYYQINTDHERKKPFWNFWIRQNCQSDWFPIHSFDFTVGAMVVGMDMVGLPFPMGTRMKENTNLINATARANINGMMDVFTMDSFAKTSAMAKAYSHGLTVLCTMVNL